MNHKTIAHSTNRMTVDMKSADASESALNELLDSPSKYDKTCRKCNLYLCSDRPRCLACDTGGFIEIEKIKNGLSHGDCPDFLAIPKAG